MFIIKEKFRPEMVGKMTEKMVSILQKRLGTFMNVSPFAQSNTKGEDVYLGTIQDKYLFSFEFNQGAPVSVTVYKSLDPNQSYRTLVFAGYNIVQVMDEITEFLSDFLSGKAIDLRSFDDISEARGRKSTKFPIFIDWLSSDKDYIKLIQTEGLTTLYSVYFKPWAIENGQIMSIATFRQSILKYLRTNKLTSKRIGVTLVIHGKSFKEVPPPSEEQKTWDEIYAASFDGKFDFLEKSIDMLVKGFTNGLLVFGGSGIGKTFNITEWVLNKVKKVNKRVFILKGSSIKDIADLYEFLFENKDNTIMVFDDSEALWTSRDRRGLILQATESQGSGARVIDVESRVLDKLNRHRVKGIEKMPLTFEFNSQILIITNMPKHKIDPAIKDRMLMVDMTLSLEQILTGLSERVSVLQPNVPTEIKEEVLEFMIEISPRLKSISFRDYNNVMMIRYMYQESSIWKNHALNQVLKV
ncbi:MAG: AAA family ATPase [Candidatus Lokiarchaeota archaeon]|nr:AAA family ATPase [Candidatus Lokiarchaeota archaeon]